MTTSIFVIVFLVGCLQTVHVISQRQPWPLKVDHIGVCCGRLPVGQPTSNNISIYADALRDCLAEQTPSLTERHANSNISVVSLASQGQGDHAIHDISLFAPFHQAIVGAYAEFKGYDFRMFAELPDEVAASNEPDYRWNKIPLLRLAMKTWAKRSEYVVWIDADAIITDFNFDVTTFVRSFPEADFIASADIRLGLINTGFFILRNSPAGRQLLDRWWTIGDRHRICDQEAFDMLYTERIQQQAAAEETLSLADRTRKGHPQHRIDENIIILPMDILNTNPPAWKTHGEHNRILHLMGESALYRTLVFQPAFQSICRARSGGILVPQLGITQELMMLTGKKVYRDATQRTFIQANRTGDVQDIEELSKAAHHYVDILQHLHAQQQDEQQQGNRHNPSSASKSTSFSFANEVLRIREGIFHLILEHIHRLRETLRRDVSTSSARSDLLSQLVNLMKKAAEAGNAWFWATTAIEHRKHIGQQVLEILQELLVRVIDAHKLTPLHMQALMNQNLGLSLYEQAMRTSVTASPPPPHSSTSSQHTDFVKQSLLLDAEYYYRESIRLFDVYWSTKEQVSKRMKKTEGGRDTHSPSEMLLPPVEFDKAVHREYVQSLQVYAGLLCLRKQFHEGVMAWQRAMEAAEETTQDITIGLDYEKLGIIYYNAAVCHAEYGHILSSSGASGSDKKASVRHIDVLQTSYRLVTRSSSIFQQMINDHHRRMSATSSSSSSSSTIHGYEISDVPAFLRQVQSLEHQVMLKLTDLGLHPLKDDRTAQTTEASTAVSSPPPSPVMKRIVLSDGSVKYVLQQQPTPDRSHGQQQDEAVHVPSPGPPPSPREENDRETAEEDEEWEECTDVDDPECLVFDVDEASAAVIDITTTATSDSASALPSTTTTTTTTVSNSSSSDADDEKEEEVEELDYILYEGITHEAMQDMKSARERQRRLFAGKRHQPVPPPPPHQSKPPIMKGNTVEEIPSPASTTSTTATTTTTSSTTTASKKPSPSPSTPTSTTTTNEREAALLRRIVLLEKMLLESEEEKVQLRMKLVERLAAETD